MASSPDALTAEPVHRFTFTISVDDEGNEQLVPMDPGAIAARLDDVRARHPELVVPAKTEQERNELTARKLRGNVLARVGREHSRRPQQRGTTRATRSTRRVRTAAASSSGNDPPRAEGDDDPPGPEHPLVARVCAVCGAALEGRHAHRKPRKHKKTCSDRCRTAYGRQRRQPVSGRTEPTPHEVETNGNGHNGNGHSNGNGRVLTEDDHDFLATPAGQRWREDLIARANLKRVGGFQGLERRERDLDRAIEKGEEVAW